MAVFRGFSKTFSELATRLQLKLETSKRNKWVWSLGPNQVQCCEKSKETDIRGFSHILHGEYILKQEVVVIQTPEWKFKANIARNVMFQGCWDQIFA